MFLRATTLFNRIILQGNCRTFLTKHSKSTFNRTRDLIVSSQGCQVYHLNHSFMFSTKNEKEEVKKDENENKDNTEKTENTSESKKKEEKEKSSSSSSSSDEDVSLEKYKELKKDYLLIAAKTELYKKKFEEARKAYIETKEETESMRKRLEKENSLIKEFAITKFAKDLLDVCDNFDRALNSIKDKDFDSLTPEEKISIYNNFVDGIVMTQNVLSNTLKKHGVSEYSPLNEKFDPNKHDAVFDYDDEERVFIK